MSAPVRVQLSRAKGWRMPENTVVVSRSSKWGNPFIVGKDGTREECAQPSLQEAYQACTGATGEPGDWNGAEPVKARLAALSKSTEREAG